MKEINLFIRSEDLSKVTNIFTKHKVGMTFFDINGTGRTPRGAPEVIHSYSTGRSTIPKFVQRIEVKSVVPDSSAKQIVDELLTSFDATSEPYGVMFIKDISTAYELGSSVIGDEVLSSR
jgi:nitrogen regulatory protein P-II 1